MRSQLSKLASTQACFEIQPPVCWSYLFHLADRFCPYLPPCHPNFPCASAANAHVKFHSPSQHTYCSGQSCLLLRAGECTRKAASPILGTWPPGLATQSCGAASWLPGLGWREPICWNMVSVKQHAPKQSRVKRTVDIARWFHPFEPPVQFWPGLVSQLDLHVLCGFFCSVELLICGCQKSVSPNQAHSFWKLLIRERKRCFATNHLCATFKGMLGCFYLFHVACVGRNVHARNPLHLLRGHFSCP